MNRGKTIALLIIAFASNKIYAGNPPVVKPVRIPSLSGGGQFINRSDWNFVENKGQLADDNGNPLSDIKYYGRQGGVNLYCKPGMISFVFTKVENDGKISEATGTSEISSALSPAGGCRGWKNDWKPRPSKITTNKADLILVNSNPSAQILASDQQEYYENYYTTGNADSGITNVHTYKTVTYKSIYPNIDFVLHACPNGPSGRAKENGMEYEFVVYPGGKVGDIQMQWNGLEGIKRLKNSGIEYCFALGKMDEGKPVSFQGQNFVESDFLKHSNVVGFKVNRYNKTKTLVIDPTLVWGTYFGGSGFDNGYGIITDPSGNIFIDGETRSTSGIATNGVYQTSLNGSNLDAFIAKFSSSGNRIWCTYFGGDDDDEAISLALDKNDNIFITGSTLSKTGIATTGAYQTNYSGAFDVIIAKFSSFGLRIWSSYYGGSSDDQALSIAIDASDNALISGSTSSKTNIATAGSYQTKFGGGYEDCFIAKFSNSGILLWSTYFGGNQGERGWVSTDKFNNIYLCGGTASTAGIATVGSFESIYGGGGYDGFIAKFSTNGSIVWSTYFGGSGYDYFNRAVADPYGNIFICGSTSSNSGIATPGKFQSLYAGGNYDCFISKFNTNGGLIWCTYYGGNGDDYSSGITINVSGDLVISGSTNSTTGIADANAYQNKLAGGNDVFVASLDSFGNKRFWSTYYGGAGDEEAFSIASDKSGTALISGTTNSTSGIATMGSFQDIFGGGGDDAFIAKFNSPKNYTDAGIDSIITPFGSSCKDSFPIVVQLKNYGIDTINSTSIIFAINGKSQTSYSWTGSLYPDSTININIGTDTFPRGTDTLKVWSENPNGGNDSVPSNDTSKSIFQVHTLPPANAGPDTTLCYDETYIMKGSGGISYTWHPATYLSSATDPNALAILPNTEHYELIVQNSFGCIDSAPVLLKVRPKLKIKAAVNPNIVCYGNPITLYAKGSGGDSLHYQYQWLNDNMTGDTIIEKPSQSGWNKVILRDNCSPANAIDSVYVTVIPPAKADFVYVPAQFVKVNQNVSFQNRSSNAAKYLWEFGSNDSSTVVSPDHIYTDSGDFKVVLIAYGLNHCPNDTAYGFIKIIGPQFVIYIPNAFSPNNDGINDYFDISGIGIKSYSYNIYNRWGEHIFSAHSGVPPVGGVSPLSAGRGAGGEAWDGTFKGVQVPESIYIYQLDVTDIEGKHHYLSGNITLMR